MYHIKDDKRTKTTTKLITDALTSMILEHKWDHLTITSLTKNAQVSRATFYRSFDIVEDVLQYQVDQTLDSLFQTLFAELSQRSFFYEIELYYLFFRFWNQHDELLKILVLSNQKELFHARLTLLYKEKLSFVQKLLVISDEHWQYFVVLRSSMLSNGLFVWLEKGKKESPEEISKILLLSFSEPSSVKMSLTSCFDRI